jgi:hypothetical protein
MLYIQDDRYRITTLDVVLAADDAAASELARVCLAGSAHYQSIEVWEDERLVTRVEKNDFPFAPAPGGEVTPNGSAEAP